MSRYPLDVAALEIQGEGGLSEDQAFIARYHQAGPDAADADVVHAAITLPATGTTTVTTAITNPDVARALSITGNAAGITGNVVITGTDVNGDAITDTIALSGASTVAGVKAFRTVTQIVVPVRNASGDTVTIGVCDKLGLEHCLTHNTVLFAFLNNTKEGTAPTVVVDDDEVCKNTVDLNTALDGNAVDIYYLV